MIEIFAYIILVFTLNFLLKKINYLPNYIGQAHQLFTSQRNIPLSGGIFVLMIIFFVFQDNLIFLLTSFFIFLIGIASDKNYVESPKKRIILQILVVFFFVYNLDLTIASTRIDLIDKLLENNFFAFFFISFCILVLINGSNFIDGLNGLLIGYFMAVVFVVYKLGLLNQIGFDESNLTFLFSSFGFILILNYLSYFYLGDSGSYLLGILISFILISIYNLNQYLISPYFIILLLWYPCFENLFSIVRKNKKNLSPIYPDDKHLHQLIFFYFNQKVKMKINYLNCFTSVLINLYNFIIFYIASLKINHTIYQILLLFVCVSTYIVLYLSLNKKIKLIFKKK
tara:strand:+ start:1051 stop:2073 length:1023 start_codon:yes stop_codon:yes gene_type:complete